MASVVREIIIDEVGTTLDQFVPVVQQALGGGSV